MSELTCANCAFGNPVELADTPPSVECRRYPPTLQFVPAQHPMNPQQVVIQRLQGFPVMLAADPGCGELTTEVPDSDTPTIQSA